MAEPESSASLTGLGPEEVKQGAALYKLKRNQYRLENVVAEAESRVAEDQLNVEKLRKKLASAEQGYQTAVTRFEESKQELEKNQADQESLEEQIALSSVQSEGSPSAAHAARRSRRTLVGHRTLQDSSISSKRRSVKRNTSSGDGDESDDALDSSLWSKSDLSSGGKKKRQKSK